MGVPARDAIPFQRPHSGHGARHERVHQLLIEDARRALSDIAAGRTHEADSAIAQLQRRRAEGFTGSMNGTSPEKKPG